MEGHSGFRDTAHSQCGGRDYGNVELNMHASLQQVQFILIHSTSVLTFHNEFLST